MAYKRSNSSTAKKTAAKATAEEIHAQLLDAVTELVTREGWAKLLQSMTAANGTEIGRFSFGNMLLVWSQMPEATAVASFKAWKARGRSVVKGAKCLRVSAPMEAKQKDKNGRVVVDKNGNEKTTTFFKLIPEFDVSQTEPTWQEGGADHTLTITAPLPMSRKSIEIHGDAPAEMGAILDIQIAQLGYTVELGDTGSATGGTNPTTKTVRISDKVSEAHAVKTKAHEYAHIALGHTDDMAEYHQHRGQYETEAESVAWMISAYFGLDTSSYSAPYIGSWAGRTPEEILKTVQSSGDRVVKAFRTFLKDAGAPEAEQITEELVTA